MIKFSTHLNNSQTDKVLSKVNSEINVHGVDSIYFNDPLKSVLNGVMENPLTLLKEMRCHYTLSAVLIVRWHLS